MSAIIDRILKVLFAMNFFLCMANVSGSKRYDGYQVIKVFAPRTLSPRMEALFEKNQLDVWRYPSVRKPSYDVMVSPSVNSEIREALLRLGATVHTLITDVQHLIDKEKTGTRRSLRSKRQPRRFSYQRYHTLDEIKRWMNLFTRANRDVVELIQVGTSYEGRRILALKIGVPSTNGTKRIIWQDGLIHAREWVTGATLIWLAREMVRNYRAGDPEITEYMQQLDWYITPVWNVDGYRYTWRRDRMWRKSRSEGGSFGCYGVDLNRNFLTPMRGEGTSSDNPCSEVYHGPFAFSELESSSVQEFMTTKRSSISAILSLHSYAQSWLYPYGYTNDVSPDNEVLERLSRDAVNAMQKKHGTVYKYGTVSRVAYPVSGGSIDWSYRTLCSKYTFGVELRDTGQFGFVLPPSQIIPTAQEYFEGLKVVTRHVLQESSDGHRSGVCSQVAEST